MTAGLVFYQTCWLVLIHLAGLENLQIHTLAGVFCCLCHTSVIVIPRMLPGVLQSLVLWSLPYTVAWVSHLTECRVFGQLSTLTQSPHNSDSTNTAASWWSQSWTCIDKAAPWWSWPWACTHYCPWWFQGWLTRLGFEPGLLFGVCILPIPHWHGQHTYCLLIAHPHISVAQSLGKSFHHGFQNTS